MSLQPSNRPSSPRVLPRGQDLPDTDGKPMDSDWVCDQVRIYLIDPLRRHLAFTGRQAYVSGDSFVYYLDPNHSKVRRLGPDFYVVLGGEPRGQTKWVAWEEGDRLPTTVIEFLSPTTEERDRGKKFCVYRDIFKTQDYFLVNPDTLAIEAYHLVRGHYVASTPGPDGWYWIESLRLFLGCVNGWMRFRTPEGQILATGIELAEQERDRAEQERDRAEQEKARAEQEKARAEQEKARADFHESRVQELEAELRRLRGDT